MPAALKLERDRQLISDRNRGLSWPEVARRSGLGERQCREVYRLWREQQQDELLAADPLGVAFETLAQYEALISELVVLAETADNSNATVAALRTRAAVLTQKLALMQAIGLLPRSLGLLRVEADVRLTAVRLLEVFDEYAVSEEARRAVVAALTPAPRPVAAAAGQAWGQ